MQLKKEWYQGVESRTSRRTYKNEVLGQIEVGKMTQLINAINEESGLHIQFIEEGYEVFDGFKASYGVIKDARSFIALVGRVSQEDLKNRLGYYGEMIVLECTHLGLGTCWIGGTYDKEKCKKSIQLNSDEELIGIIAVGYVSENKTFKEKVISRLAQNSKLFNQMLVTKDEQIPTWVTKGIESALKAPSALNKKPVAYAFKENEIKVFTTKTNQGYEQIDLGISMLHFELAAQSEGHQGTWQRVNSEYIYK
ncbi:MAG: nitroreductase family protein [Cellulosilyticaceae bacterium]